MSDLYYAAFTVTALLGFFLLMADIWRHQDNIIQTLENLATWTSDNILSFLALFFLMSLAITGPAGIGII